MKMMKKLRAAVTGGVLAAGMLSALPAEALRDQLGTYRRVGDNGLYMSDSGALQVDSANRAGVQFSVQLPAQHEEIFRDEVWEILAEFSGYSEEGVKNVFDLQRVDMLTDTSNKGTEENPVYTYTLQAKNWTDGIFYMWISDFYYWLHTKFSMPLQSFKYYPDFGIVNYAGCYGYDVSGNPEMKDKIDAWLAEHAPNVETRMSADNNPGYFEILSLGWKETDDGTVHEPYNPYHDMYGIWQDLGYQPFYDSTVLYRHGEEFVIDFLQWQKYYDDISEETIEKTLKKYQLDKIRSENYHLWLGLPEDTVNELCMRSGSTYKTEYFYSPFEELVMEHDLAEGLNIGFVADIDLYHSVPQQIYENREAFKDTLFCCAEVNPQLFRAELYGWQNLMTRLYEDAHILAVLDKYLGLPFTVFCEDAAEKDPVFSKSFDELMEMSDAEISALTGTNFHSSSNQTSKPDGVTLELLLEKETVDKFWVNVVVENPEQFGGAFDITRLSTAEIARFLSLPEEMVKNPKETTFYLPKQTQIGDTELTGFTVYIDATVYGKENRDKAYSLAMMRINRTDGIYDRMIVPVGGSTSFVLGDVNLDGVMDVADAVLVARYCVSDPEAEIKTQGLKQADVNRDGEVTEKDITEILEYIARKKHQF